jgi:general stress protein 26
MATTTQPEAVAKLGELIKDIKIAMLTTVDDTDGTLRSRPMVTQDAEFDGILWFFTSSVSATAGEVQHERDVNVSYADHGKMRYVSVSGKALLIRDRKKMEEFWSPALKAWFPDGLETKDIALLQVKPVKAEYWDSPSGKFVQLVGLVKAIASGQRYEGEGAENEKLNLQ